MDWQPAETAPKDGTHILVCWECQSFNQAPPMVVHYYRGAPDEADGFYASHGIVENSYNDVPHVFAFWCPLGVPPRN